MERRIALEVALEWLEELTKLIYRLENSMFSSERDELKKLLPIFEKNFLIKEQTWFSAHEKLIHDIDYLSEKKLNYNFFDDFIGYELFKKIPIYRREVDSIQSHLEEYDEVSLRFVLSSLICDLARLLDKIFIIDIDVEVYKLSTINFKDREIAINKTIDDIQSQLRYKGNTADFILNKYFQKRREKIDRIFNSSMSLTIKSVAKNYNLISEVLRATKELQGLRINILPGEKNRTAMLTSLIKKYTAKDESGYGVSETGKSAGEIDIKLENKSGEVVSICEAFNLKKSLNKTVIRKHLQKIAGYNANGLELIFVIVFSELNKFNSYWKKYIDYVITVDIPAYKYLRSNDMMEMSSGKINVYEIVYRLNNKLISIYHVFVDMK